LEGNWKVEEVKIKVSGRWLVYNVTGFSGKIALLRPDELWLRVQVMNHDLTGKKALIISDNGGLARVVELNLSIRLGMHVSKYEPGAVEDGFSNDLDLLVLAISSPSKEPIVELARASLVERIGQVPLLIISDRPFQSEPGEPIVHLDFPFSIDALEIKAREVLSKNCRPRLVTGDQDSTIESAKNTAGVSES
jgi:hypothetical protein